MWRIRKSAFTAVIVSTLALVAAGQTNTARVSEWRHDIDAIVKDIRSFHPNPFTKTGEAIFLREAETLKTAIPSLTEEQRVVRAMRLVALLGDGHTHLEPDNPAFAFWYPIRLYEFTDGYFVTSAHRSVSELAGAQVLEIAGRPANEVVAGARQLMGADNDFSRKERLYAVHNVSLMKGLGYAESTGELKIKFKLRDGRIVERLLAPKKADNPHYKDSEARFEWPFSGEMFGAPFGTADDWVSAFKGLPASAFQKPDASRPPHLTSREVYVVRKMPEQSAYYIQANQVDDNWAHFFKDTLREVDKIRPRRLIIDLRYNSGGDGSYVTAMIHEFIKREDNQPWKELYILTGRKTFSAAVMVLRAFMENVQITVVGEPPGSALNHYGDAIFLKYPRTGLRLAVSTLRHELSGSNDRSEFVAVDVPAPFSFDDYAGGRDPALDPILRGEEMRSMPVIALTSGGAAVRKAYEDRKIGFAKYPWWRPPREIDLRKACQELLDQKRLSDAVETCRVNAEVHPDIWNVWLNLGIAQRRAGLVVEQLQSFRRVLEIDPNNFNADVLLPVLADGLKPRSVQYGATVAATQTALMGACATSNTRRIEPPFLPDVKDKQMQIDCEGFQFLGKPRRAEFVFQDDSLEMIWIMTSAEEEDSIVKAMTDAVGAPTRRNNKYIAFTDNRTAVRRDRPEILLYSEKLAPLVQRWFETSNVTTSPK